MRAVFFLVAAIPALAHSWYPLGVAAIWIASQSAAISWWKRVPVGSTSPPATCSSMSKCSRVRTTIAMCASGAAVITARSARSSHRTCSGAIALAGGVIQIWFRSARIAEQMKTEAYPTSLRTLALRHKHRDAGQKQEVMYRHDLAVNSVGQIDARRDPLTGQWECPAL